MMIEFKILQREQVLDIIKVAGDEIIHTDHMISFLDKSVTQMRTKETGSSGDKYPFS